MKKKVPDKKIKNKSLANLSDGWPVKKLLFTNGEKEKEKEKS